MAKLIDARRIEVRGRMLSYVRYFDDFPYKPIANIWSDVRFSSRSEDKQYVVQTAAKVIERCILMTTDPGDLVLDPTCGSGTTAYVAEAVGSPLDHLRHIARRRHSSQAAPDGRALRLLRTGASGRRHRQRIPLQDRAACHVEIHREQS